MLAEQVTYYPSRFVAVMADILYLGRTTFVNTLCGKKVLQGKDSDDPENAHLEEGVRIKPVTVGKHGSQRFRNHRTLTPSTQNLSLTRRVPVYL